MGRRATGHILTTKDRRGGTTYSVRFRGDGYPHQVSDYFYRKRRKGLRPSSLTDMLNKLQAHLLPFFGEYRLDQIDEQARRGLHRAKAARE
jgi:hypothetical protein